MYRRTCVLEPDFTYLLRRKGVTAGGEEPGSRRKFFMKDPPSLPPFNSLPRTHTSETKSPVRARVCLSHIISLPSNIVCVLLLAFLKQQQSLLHASAGLCCRSVEQRHVTLSAIIITRRLDRRTRCAHGTGGGGGIDQLPGFDPGDCDEIVREVNACTRGGEARNTTDARGFVLLRTSHTVGWEIGTVLTLQDEWGRGTPLR